MFLRRSEEANIFLTEWEQAYPEFNVPQRCTGCVALIKNFSNLNVERHTHTYLEHKKRMFS
jgi:hypothetical protein